MSEETMKSSCNPDEAPQDVQQHLTDYEATGRPLGGFLTSVLENDLSKGITRADSDNLRLLPAIMSFVYNRIDGRCWGSKAKVVEWKRHNGREGVKDRKPEDEIGAPQVLIDITGGVCQDVVADSPVRVLLVDHDNLKSDECAVDETVPFMTAVVRELDIDKHAEIVRKEYAGK